MTINVIKEHPTFGCTLLILSSSAVMHIWGIPVAFRGVFQARHHGLIQLTSIE